MRAVVLVLLLLLPALPAYAQAPEAGASDAGAPETGLPGMLAELKAAPTPEAATALAEKIAAAWLREATPAVRLLLESGSRALAAHAPDEAARDFNAAITLQPDLAEAWSQRALANLQAGDATAAALDIAHALTLDPDHFTALETLSYVAQSRGDWLGALAAWKKLLTIDPEISGGEQRLKMLERRALGQST